MTSTAPLFIPSIPVQGPDHLILGFARDARRPERLVAVGGQRVDVALLSEDHGRTWQALPSPGKGLRGAWLDGDTLWVCGEYGFLACSRDGGASFTAVDTGSGGCLFGVAVATVTAACPSGINAYIMANRFRVGHALASGGILATTLVSVVTLWVVLLLLGTPV